MDERDFYFLAGSILVLCAAGILMARKLADLDTDVGFLMDHTVARETEARPS